MLDIQGVMDVRRIFRNLVSNQYMPYFPYDSQKFSFETVFNNSKSDRLRLRYCYCLCGIEHEWFEYLTDSGEIDEEIYDRVIQSIVDGKCPHVDEVPVEYLGKAEVYAVHVATAAGTLEALTDPKNQYPVYGNLFELDPYQTAVIKGNHEIASRPFMRKFYYSNESVVNSYTLPYVHRDEQNKHCVRIERIPMLEFCVRKGNVDLLRSFLKLNAGNSISFVEALLITFEKDLKEMQDILLEKMESCPGMYACFLSESFEAAVVYDKPKVLDKLLILYVCLSGRRLYHFTKERLRATCFVLQRKACANVLKKRLNISALKKMNESEKINTLFVLLYKYDFLKDEVLSTLECIPKFPDALMFTESHQASSMRYNYAYRSDSWLLKLFLDLGVDINTDLVDSQGRPFLVHLLSRNISSLIREPIRQPVELFIYENPDVLTYKSVVSMAIEYDANMMNRHLHVGPIHISQVDMDRNYIMDAKEHGWFGHDREEDFPLNFLAPLLVACGFPISDNVSALLESKKRDLHPQEYAYLHTHCCLQMPKLLTLSCRDTLRNHFKGRRIHEFVQAANAPKAIKDFILLKPLLKIVPED